MVILCSLAYIESMPLQAYKGGWEAAGAWGLGRLRGPNVQYIGQEESAMCLERKVVGCETLNLYLSWVQSYIRASNV